MAKKNTPLKVNEDLVRRTRLTSYYTSGESSTMGEWNTDKFTNELRDNSGKGNGNNGDNGDNGDNGNNGDNGKNNNGKKGPMSDFIVGPTEPEKYVMWKGEKILNPNWIVWNETYNSPTNIENNKDKIEKQHKKENNEVIQNNEVLPLIDFTTSPMLQTREEYIPSQKSPFQQTEDPAAQVYLPQIDVAGNKAKEIMTKRMLENEEKEFGPPNPKSIYNIWESIGGGFEKTKENYIENMSVGSKLDALENPRWKEAVKNYLKKVRENMSNAISDGYNDIAATWMENAQNLINNIKLFEEKKLKTWAQQYNDETVGNRGGSTVSLGSHKGDMLKYDMTYMGSDNINIQIAEEGDLYFKMRDVDDIWTVKDLGRNVFMKNFNGMNMWDNFRKSLSEKAKEGVGVSKSAIEGTVNSMLQNEESILSFAHDNMVGQQSIYEMYKEAAQQKGLRINPDVFMPESKDYNLDIIKEMVKSGLINMANQTYRNHSIKENKIDSKLTAKELINKYKTIK